MKLLLLACMLTCMGGHASVITESLAPADSNTTETQVEGSNKELDVTSLDLTPTNVPKFPSLPEDTFWLHLVMEGESHNTTTPASPPNSSYQDCTVSCMYDKLCVDHYIRALELSLFSEILLSLFYFIMTDWMKIIQLKRIVLSSVLVVCSSVYIFFSLKFPEIDRFSVFTTYNYSTIFMLFVGVGVSVSDGFFTLLRDNGVVVAVGAQIQLRKPCYAFVYACGLQVVLSVLSCMIGLTFQLVLRLPCSDNQSEDLPFSQIPPFFYLSWIALAFGLLMYLDKRQGVSLRLQRPYSLNLLTYIAIHLLFLLWFVGLAFLALGVSAVWIFLQVVYFFMGILIGLFDTVVDCEVGPSILGCRVYCLR